MPPPRSALHTRADGGRRRRRGPGHQTTDLAPTARVSAAGPVGGTDGIEYGCGEATTSASASSSSGKRGTNTGVVKGGVGGTLEPFRQGAEASMEAMQAVPVEDGSAPKVTQEANAISNEMTEPVPDSRSGRLGMTFESGPVSVSTPMTQTDKLSLAALRAQVGRNFACADVRRSTWEVMRESSRLARELRYARSEQEDIAVDAEWMVEADHWRKEAHRLKALLDEQEQRELEAQSELIAELHAEDLGLADAEHRTNELSRKQAHCEAEADEAERSNIALRQRLEREAALGPAGGGAQLFVSALPALDHASIQWARDAVEKKLRQLERASQE